METRLLLRKPIRGNLREGLGEDRDARDPRAETQVIHAQRAAFLLHVTPRRRARPRRTVSSSLGDSHAPTAGLDLGPVTGWTPRWLGAPDVCCVSLL